jgi:lipopolysaccharide/colanic/teichoic acid biosynthesis glycosyltransferase
MSFRESMALDLAYRKRWSLGMDLTIIRKTLTILARQLLSARGPVHF